MSGTGTRAGISWRRIMVQFAIGAVGGAVAASLMFRLVDGDRLAGSHMPGLLVAVIVTLTGLFIAWSATSDRRAADAIGLSRDPGESLGEERRSLGAQGLVTLMAGVELGILSLDPELLNGPARTILIAGLLALLAVQTVINVRLWRSGDELFRRLVTEASMAAFLIFQFLLFFWVVGAQFRMVDDPSALDLYVLCLVLYLGAGAWIGVRRGYGVPVEA